MDIITYALCKNLVKKASTGITKIESVFDEIAKEYYLVFILTDGKEIKVKIPMKLDAINMQTVDVLPISNISDTTIYLIKRGTLNPVYSQYMYIDKTWVKIGQSGEPIATKTEAGLVKPDNETLELKDEEGTIGVDEEYLSETINTAINNKLADKDTSLSEDDIENLDWD